VRTLTPLLQKALFRLLADKIRDALDQAKRDHDDCVQEARFFQSWLDNTGDKRTWGADARKAKRELAAAKKTLDFWKKVAAELKPTKRGAR